MLRLRGLCVRGAEHLNINNCHADHLGPHSQLAPWAHSHHGAAATETHIHTHTRTLTFEEVTVYVQYIWIWARETESQPDTSREKDLRVTSAPHDDSLFPTILFFLVLSAVCERAQPQAVRIQHRITLAFSCALF